MRSITSSDTRRGIILALDAFPLEEPLPIRRQRADAAVRAVRGDEQRVEPEQRRDLLLVVRQVLVERRARGHAGLLQLDDHQWQADDEADQIRPAGVERAGNAELAESRKSLFDGFFKDPPSRAFLTTKGGSVRLQVRRGMLSRTRCPPERKCVF